MAITSTSYKVALVEVRTAQGECELFFVSNADDIKETMRISETGESVTLIPMGDEAQGGAMLKIKGIYKPEDILNINNGK